MAKADSWTTRSIPLDEFLASDDENIIPPGDIYEVPANKLKEAEGYLDKKSIVELKKTEVMDLFGIKVAAAPGYKRFLVRGVTQNKETGSFMCIYFRKMLWVFNGALGSESTPVAKQPIIILLRERPNKVFVSSSIRR